MTATAYLSVVALALTMFATGLGLRGRDLQRVADMPGSTVLGLGLQSLLMPIFVALFAKAILPASSEGFGLVLVALAPATVSSHVFVGLAGGHMGLARTLTLCSSFTSLIAYFSLDLDQLFPGLLQLILLAYLLPFLLGLALPLFQPKLAQILERRMIIYASALTGLTVLVTLWSRFEWDHISLFFLSLAIALCCGLFGWGAGRMIGPGKGEAIGLSLPMQNFALPLAITWVAGVQEMTVAPALYAIAMYLASFLLIALWRRFR